MLKFRKCSIDGCNNMARNRGHRRGTICDKHHNLKYPNHSGKSRDKLKRKLIGVPCQKCGWSLAPRDIHRIIPGSQGGRYTTPYVLVLCPNCHIPTIDWSIEST